MEVEMPDLQMAAPRVFELIERGVDLKVSLPLRVALSVDRLKGASCIFRDA